MGDKGKAVVKVRGRASDDSRLISRSSSSVLLTSPTRRQTDASTIAGGGASAALALRKKRQERAVSKSVPALKERSPATASNAASPKASSRLVAKSDIPTNSSAKASPLTKQCEREGTSTNAANSSSDTTLGHKLRGLSVYHIRTVLLARMRELGHDESATVHDIVPKVICDTTRDVTCPRDGRKGAAYVDSVYGDDNAGISTFMLSFSWGYTVSDISATLVQHCNVKDLDQKRTYIWLCCCCINQHRVRDMQAAGEIVPFEEFKSTFAERVTNIGHVLAMMAPWRDPTYLKRVWCNFELFTASETGIPVTILLPPREELDYLESLLAGSGIEDMWKTLGNIDVQRADASVLEDKTRILRMIEEGQGFHKLNSTVASHLQAWIVGVSEDLWEREQRAENCSHNEMIVLCNIVGDLLIRTGKPDRALWKLEKTQRWLEQCGGSLENRQGSILFRNMVRAKRSLGDEDGANSSTSHAVAIEERILPSDCSDNDVHALTQSGLSKQHKGDLAGAIQDYETARACLEKSGSIETVSGVALMMNIANAKTVQGDLCVGLDLYTEARRILVQIGSWESPTGSQLMNNIGNLMRMRHEHDGCLKAYNESRYLREKLGTLETPEGAVLLANIGIVMGETGNMEGAIEAAELAIKVFTRLNMLDTKPGQLALRIISMAKEQEANSRVGQSSKSTKLPNSLSEQDDGRRLNEGFDTVVQIEEKMRECSRMLFNQADLDRDGFISVHELTQLLMQFDKAWTEAKANKLLVVIKSAKTSMISSEEFLKFVSLQFSKTSRPQNVRDVFAADP
eukprot:TRINITY_DN68224_c0_g1_i1.p1 TRINITY_DN68224_c0_g1~~TRINITY_DN68224_c0_g1_i1.p1  ORF type:complete len:799 (+),score=119.65 TRINITY_DN68224_c0_g1_i1:225-2621(+)